MASWIEDLRKIGQPFRDAEKKKNEGELLRDKAMSERIDQNKSNYLKSLVEVKKTRDLTSYLWPTLLLVNKEAFNSQGVASIEMKFVDGATHESFSSCSTDKQRTNLAPLITMLAKIDSTYRKYDGLYIPSQHVINGALVWDMKFPFSGSRCGYQLNTAVTRNFGDNTPQMFIWGGDESFSSEKNKETIDMNSNDWKFQFQDTILSHLQHPIGCYFSHSAEPVTNC